MRSDQIPGEHGKCDPSRLTRTGELPLLPDRVVAGHHHVAHHDGREVELGGHPDADAQPVEADVAATRRAIAFEGDFMLVTYCQDLGEGRYRVTETCQEVQGPQPSTYEVEQEYEVLAEDRYRVNFEGGGSSEFRFCPQDSLPESWRDNDISDVLD